MRKAVPGSSPASDATSLSVSSGRSAENASRMRRPLASELTTLRLSSRSSAGVRLDTAARAFEDLRAATLRLVLVFRGFSECETYLRTKLMRASAGESIAVAGYASGDDASRRAARAMRDGA